MKLKAMSSPLEIQTGFVYGGKLLNDCSTESHHHWLRRAHHKVGTCAIRAFHCAGYVEKWVGMIVGRVFADFDVFMNSELFFDDVSRL